MSKLDFTTSLKQEEAYLRLLYPTPDDIPGCMSLFDTFLSCNGELQVINLYCLPLLNLAGVIRSQIKSLYRYGERPDCSQKLEDFKFCLTLKSLHPEERRDAWIRRRAEWWVNRRMSRSSEDVWDIRGCVVFLFSRGAS